ncbi:MAG: methionyl-tRNA formyltransferase [Sulfurospirillum sp.]
MRIVFMGTPDYATQILKGLVNSDIEVSLLVTQPDKPVGRKQILTPPHVKAWVKKEDICLDIYQPKSLRNDEAKERISAHKPDFIVVAAYGQILPVEILNIAPCINLHASLLPKYRGASPIQSSILNGDKFTGVTAMLMEEGLDSGDILAFKYVQMFDCRVDELFDELSIAASKLTLLVLNNFESIEPIKQIGADATHCVKIKKNNGLFSFKQSAKEIYTKFKAYTPWPGLFLENGLKIKKIELLDETKQFEKSAVILEISKDYIVIACQIGSLKILKVQAPSKKEISAVEYVRGKRMEVGSSLV